MSSAAEANALVVAAQPWRDAAARYVPGLLLAGVVAIASSFIASTRGGPTLLYALLLGMALNPVAMEGRARAGVDLAARKVLRLGVALLGARITFAQIGALGWHAAAILLLCVPLTIAFGVFAARVLKLRRALGILTGGATAICGASAAIAIATVLPRDERTERELIFTIAGVTALSTLAMVAYPLLANALHLDPHAAGLFLGGTIHDVAQVVGAGYSMSAEVGDFAVLAKLMRVALLLPVVVALSFAVRGRMQQAHGPRGEGVLPGFLLAFAALVVMASLGWIPEAVAAPLNDLARTCLVFAIAAVGLKTSLVEMKKVGGRAFLLLVAEALFLLVLLLGSQRLGT